MELSSYFRRLGYTGSTEPSPETLRQLHRQHLFVVPFENLDIHYGRRIDLREEAILRKIVDERRGGFCYELNEAFALLLEGLGFRVTRLSARVYRPDGATGPEFDHMCLAVEAGETFLTDVGFGDSFVYPLPLVSGLETEQAGFVYRLSRNGERWRVQRHAPGEAWKPQYDFTLQPRALADYAAMCDFHQSSPESHFTRKRVCSRATASGRITLSDLLLIETDNGQRRETPLADEVEFHKALGQYFGMKLEAGTSGNVLPAAAMGRGQACRPV